MIDLNGKHLVTRYLGTQLPLDIHDIDTGWTELLLSRRLDSKLYQPDIRQETLLEFLRRTINDLIRQRGYSLETLARGRFILEKALRRKIMDYRQQACQRGYQHALFGGQMRVETSYTYAFNFDPNQYPAHWHYSGGYQFGKHYYPAIGELESKGEEFECAQAIDRCSLVKHWVRNITNQPVFSFRLPLAEGYFYPDFTAELKDGRILVVEYKGAHLVEGAQEKLNIGQLWEQKSIGRGLFLMAVKQDDWGRDVYRQLEDKVIKT